MKTSTFLRNQKNLFQSAVQIIALMLLLATTAFAQAPQGISFQAVARNSSGVELVSQPISVRISIHDSIATGNIVYQETYSLTTTPHGGFNVNIGMGTATIGTFSSINWGQNNKYTQVELDPTGGTSYVTLDPKQIMSVPYALYANNGLPNGNIGDMLYNTGSAWAKIPAGTDGQYLKMCGGLPTWGACVALLNTITISSINTTSAIAGGNISIDGGSPIIAKGVCWSTSTGPIVSLSTKTTDGIGIGSYTSNITGLFPNTTYYVRAYATNGMGTAYGNEISFTTFHTIGDSYQGGIIAYILQPGDPGYDAFVPHGLISATSDQSSGAIWGCQGTTTGAWGTAIGTGAANTATILSACSTSGIAAKLCHDYTGGGYTDWYLPSQNELNILYTNRVSIGIGFSGYHWSSTEFSGSSDVYAWCLYYSTLENTGKNSSLPVRAVRSF